MKRSNSVDIPNSTKLKLKRSISIEKDIYTEFEIIKPYVQGHLKSFTLINHQINGLNLDHEAINLLNNDLKMLSVFTGKNGVGKTKLLKFMRQSIVNGENKAYPNFIVRVLTYGEETDNYQPDLNDHPLVENSALEKYWGCNFEKWLDYFDRFSTMNNSSEFQNIKAKQEEYFEEKMQIEELIKRETFLFKCFFNYYKNFFLECQIILNSPVGKKEIYYSEFKKYFKRQILKKICYGSLEQLLKLNMRYKFEIDDINLFLRAKNIEKYGLEFKYDIFVDFSELTNKSDVKDCILFNSTSDQRVKGLKIKDLSPGERLILNLMLILREKENIKMAFNGKTKQILLFDEPDSHCEPSLVKSILEIIKTVIIGKLNIQVIMTTHNTTTIRLLGLDRKNIEIANNCLFVLHQNENKSIGCTKDIGHALKLLGNDWIETLSINYTNIKYEGNQLLFLALNVKNNVILGLFAEYIMKCIFLQYENKIILDKSEEHLFLESLYLKNIIGHHLKFVPVQTLNECFEGDLLEKYFKTPSSCLIYIFWPIDTTNRAWDFLILDKTDMIIHFHQVTIRDDVSEKAKKTTSIHFKDIDPKLQNPILQAYHFKYYLIHGNNMVENSQLIHEYYILNKVLNFIIIPIDKIKFKLMEDIIFYSIKIKEKLKVFISQYNFLYENFTLASNQEKVKTYKIFNENKSFNVCEKQLFEICKIFREKKIDLTKKPIKIITYLETKNCKFCNKRIRLKIQQDMEDHEKICKMNNENFLGPKKRFF